MSPLTRRTFMAGSALAGIPLLKGAQPTGDATAWPRYVHAKAFDLQIPAQHPYLLLRPEMIERAKQHAAGAPWARQRMDRIFAEADALVANPWGELPPPSAPEREQRASLGHTALGSHLASVAMAHALSGKPQYAEWVRDGLLAYAKLFPTLPMVRGRRLFNSTLSESMWVVNAANAYDLAAGSGAFTTEQAKRVEEDLLRIAPKSVQIDQYDNFQAWNIAAVGLSGLAIRDKDMVDWAVNSRRGYMHIIAHDFCDDGMYWERSESYHTFVLQALLGFTEPMLHCGVDMYNVSLPPDWNDDEALHYLTDTSSKPKSLQMMFEPLFYMTFPDLTYPVLGDAEYGPIRANGTFLIATNRYRDAKLDWLVYRDRPEARSETPERPSRASAQWQWLVYDLPANAPAVCPIQEGRFANTGEYRNGCTLLPSTGLAILREASGNYTTQPETTAVSLSYGPHGGGHGHSNALDLVLYAHNRQWIPAFTSMPYETNWKYDWTAQTISNNTIVADGISQKPTGTRHVQWPEDNSTDRVCGVLEHYDSQAKSVSAHCDNTYANIHLHRALRLIRHAAVDAFTATDTKGAEHQYDYVLHVDGVFESGSAPLETASGKLGDTCGYQLVEQKSRGSVEQPFHLTFSNEGKQLRIWVPDSGATEMIVAEGLTNRPERKMQMLVLRRRGMKTRFLAVLEPVRAENPIRSVKTENGEMVIEFASGAIRVAIE